MDITAPSTQTVGQSLTLQCEVTIVRGITSRMDIVWRNGSMELIRRNNTVFNNQLMYTDSYIIQLTTDHNNNTIHCEVVINASPSVMASDSITLNVTGT